MYQVMTGVGLPVTSHTKLVDWLKTNDTLLCVSLSRKSGGTAEILNMITGLKAVIFTYLIYVKHKTDDEKLIPKSSVRTRKNRLIPLTLSWYFLSVDPASLAAAQTYSPLSSGDKEARISSVPSSRMDTPGSLPVSSCPLRNHRITGLGRPERDKRA